MRYAVNIAGMDFEFDGTSSRSRRVSVRRFSRFTLPVCRADTVGGAALMP